MYLFWWCIWHIYIYIYIYIYEWKNWRGCIDSLWLWVSHLSTRQTELSDKRKFCLTSESSVWQALRCKTQSHRESMRPLWFFNLYMLSSATTALSTFCQGRLYPHISIYVCLLLQKSRSSWLWELRHYMGMMLCTQQNISLLICQWQMHEWLIECKTSF